MVEQSNAEQEVGNFKKLAVLKLDQNICRVQALGGNRFLCASYHLDKENQTKQGKLYTVSVDEASGQISLQGQSEPWPYGILSVQLHGGEVSAEGSGSAISQASFVSLGCSDGTLRLVSCDTT